MRRRGSGVLAAAQELADRPDQGADHDDRPREREVVDQEVHQAGARDSVDQVDLDRVVVVLPFVQVVVEDAREVVDGGHAGEAVGCADRHVERPEAQEGSEGDHAEAGATVLGTGHGDSLSLAAGAAKSYMNVSLTCTLQARSDVQERGNPRSRGNISMSCTVRYCLILKVLVAYTMCISCNSVILS